jgi:phenylpropionate dioxygenase-like ring-hydroxylating dioxygenase large terminal subunit
MSQTDYAELVLPDRVHSSLYRDADIFNDEVERIFYRTWIWVAHASEIPNQRISVRNPSS